MARTSRRYLQLLWRRLGWVFCCSHDWVVFLGWGLGSSRIVDTLTVVIYLAGTIQFLTVAKLLVTLTSLHGAYLLTVSAIGFFALIRYIMPGTSRQV